MERFDFCIVPFVLFSLMSLKRQCSIFLGPHVLMYQFSHVPGFPVSANRASSPMHALSPYAVTLEKIWRKLTCLQQPRHFCTILRQHSSHSTFSFSPSVLTCLLSYSSLNTASLSSKICLPNHFRKTSLQIGHRNFVPFLSRCALISLILLKIVRSRLKYFS